MVTRLVRILELLRVIEQQLEDREVYGLEWAFEEIRDLLGVTKFGVSE